MNEDKFIHRHLKRRQALSLLAVLLTLPSALWATPTQETSDKHKTHLRTFCETHLISISRFDHQIAFTSDGKLGTWIGDGTTKRWVSDWSLAPNGTFYTQPDHHSAIEFTVLAVSDTGVTIGYTSRFDHRSFGKDLLTIDRGSFEIDYFRRQSQ